MLLLYTIAFETFEILLCIHNGQKQYYTSIRLGIYIVYNIQIII